MQEDHIFQHSDEFWRTVLSTLRCTDPLDIHTANARLVRFLKTVADHVLIFVNTDQDLYRCARALVSAELYECNRHFCVSKLLSLLNTGCLDQNFTLVASYVLLLCCKNDSTLLQVLEDYGGFTVLYHSLHVMFETLALLEDDNATGQANDSSNSLALLRKTCVVQLDLMFQMCKYLSIPQDELAIIDTFFINYIFESLVVADVDDVYNAAKFKFILAVNEQFMISMGAQQHKLENKVISTIAAHTTFRNFSECLLMFFNREQDRCLQIMISKILYLIFTTNESSDLFYHNDLNVLVDVLIRELNNLSDEDDSIRNTFLRVLYTLLRTQQFEKHHYKKTELLSLLNYLAGVGQTFWNPSETTKRLAVRCLSVKWLQIEDSVTDVASINSDTSSMANEIHLRPSCQHNSTSESSLLSMSKKGPPPAPSPLPLPLAAAAPPPPPPLPRKSARPYTLNR